MPTVDRDPQQAVPAPIPQADQRRAQSYTLPDAQHLYDAERRAEELWSLSESGTGDDEAARIMCLMLAAALRDILTDHDHVAAFDATGLELDFRHGAGTATGVYWTASGHTRRIADPVDVGDLDYRSWQLRFDNRGGWEPLCTPTGRHNVYRLDLPRAAAATTTN